MATRSDLQVNDIVMITDLASNSGRTSPHAALGRIQGFLDPESRSQAIVRYHSGTVDRPVSRLVRVVKADEKISEKGKCICPLAMADEVIQQAWDETEDTHLPEPEGDVEDHQNGDQQEDYQSDDQQEELPLHVQGEHEEDQGEHQEDQRNLPAEVPPRHQDSASQQVAMQPGRAGEGDTGTQSVPVAAQGSGQSPQRRGLFNAFKESDARVSKSESPDIISSTRVRKKLSKF